MVKVKDIEALPLFKGLTEDELKAFAEIITSSSQALASVHKISVSTLDQDYGLEDSRGIFAAGYNYGARYVGVRHTRSLSAVSDITTITNSLYISYRFSDAWRTELSTGSVDDSITESRFFCAALGYYW